MQYYYCCNIILDTEYRNVIYNLKKRKVKFLIRISQVNTLGVYINAGTNFARSVCLLAKWILLANRVKRGGRNNRESSVNPRGRGFFTSRSPVLFYERSKVVSSSRSWWGQVRVLVRLSRCLSVCLSVHVRGTPGPTRARTFPYKTAAEKRAWKDKRQQYSRGEYEIHPIPLKSRCSSVLNTLAINQKYLRISVIKQKLV